MRPLALPLAGLLALLTVPAHAASGTLDLRLAAATRPGAAPVAVWVEFADKGERGPADLAARLAAAEAALTPEARRRRERAHVRPLVDWLDLPVAPEYVETLRAAGYVPYGASRWFNRVAVRTGGESLTRLAALTFVRRVAPVELAVPRARVAPEATGATGGGEAAPARALPAAVQVLYGQTATQLARLNVPAVHDLGYVGTGVNVCLLDDGFNWYRKHEALKPIIVGLGRTRDFIRGGASVQDTLDSPADFEHGTGVLSVLAGRKLGVYVGPGFGANLILGRTEDLATEKPIEMVYWAMGAEWADSLGADILGSSLGYNLFPDSAGTDITYPMLDGHTTIVTRAAEIAAAKGILVVVSAGNDGNNPSVGRKIGAPGDANGDSVLTIGAVDSLGVRVGFSSKGPTADGRIKPDLVAQGLDVLQAFPSSDPQGYWRANGTSFSAPLVAGLAACLMQAHPTWPPVWVIQALKRTASRAANPDTLVGYGLPDGLAALRFVPDTAAVPPLHGPLRLALAGPNPLRADGPPVEVRVSLGSEAAATSYRLRLYDASGRRVRELGAGTLSPGSMVPLQWRGDDAHGRTLVPGLYFLTLEGAGRRDALRVVVLR